MRADADLMEVRSKIELNILTTKLSLTAETLRPFDGRWGQVVLYVFQLAEDCDLQHRPKCLIVLQMILRFSILDKKNVRLAVTTINENQSKACVVYPLNTPALIFRNASTVFESPHQYHISTTYSDIPLLHTSGELSAYRKYFREECLESFSHLWSEAGEIYKKGASCP